MKSYSISSISLSAAESIDYTADRYTGDFNFAETIHSFVNNLEFGEGFLANDQTEKSSRRFVWDVLSAVGQDVGRKLYSNILNYVDNVSNADTCRIRALRSMMKLTGMNYKILENIQYFPLEIQRLLDIFSISKDLVTRSQFMEDDFIRFLSADGFITDRNGMSMSADNATAAGIKDLFGELSALPRFSMTDEQYDDYIFNTMRDFIFDMLTMNYAGNSRYLYQDLEEIRPFDGEETDLQQMIRDYKTANNVDFRFSPETVLDEIELGNDSLDNYAGAELSLLLEIRTRRETTDMSKFKTDNSSSIDYCDLQLRNKYAYYRKRKVLEFAEFVEQIYGRPIQLSVENINIYEYDPNYFHIGNASTKRIFADEITGVPEQDIDMSMVDLVAKYLTQMARIVRRLRNRLKLQARKVFMKGTNNLLIFAVNEFVIDYIEQLHDYIFSLTEKDNPNIKEYQEQISVIYDRVKNHSFNDVEVVEYWDTTEYMNISALTTNRAANQNLVNERFFDRLVPKSNGRYAPRQPAQFTNHDIMEFYLSALGMKDNIEAGPNVMATSPDQKLLGFLDTLYDIGADPTFRYKDDPSIYGTKIDAVVTVDRYTDLISTLTVNRFMQSLQEKCDNYEFDSGMSLLEQRVDFQDGVYRSYLSDMYLSGIYEMRDKYMPEINSLSNRLDNKILEYNNFLSGTYSYYYKKSDNPYCLDDAGNYTLDYLIGSDDYSPDDFYAYNLDYSLNWIQQEGHCRNWPILCASVKLREEYDILNGMLYNTIINDIVLSGFIDPPDVESLKVKMDSASDFLEASKNQRRTYLMNALDNFRQQASNLKTTYDGLANSLDAILARMPDTSQGYYIKVVESGSYAAGKSKKKANIFDIYSGSWYHESEKKSAIYAKASFPKLDTTSFTTRATSAKSIIEALGKVYYGEGGTGGPSPVASMEPLDSILKNYQTLQSQLDKIIASIQSLFSLDDNETLNGLKSSATSSVAVEDRITTLVAFLSNNITDIDFQHDIMLSSIISHINDLISLSAQYVPKNMQYLKIWQMFGTYLTEFDSKYDQNVWAPSILNELYEYTITQDKKNLERIVEWYDVQRQDYNEIQTTLYNLVLDGIELYNGYKLYDYNVYPGYLEEQLDDFSTKLNIDVQSREQIGNDAIDAEIDVLSRSFDRILEIFYRYLRQTIGSGDYRDDNDGPARFEQDFYAIVNRTWLDIIEEILETIDYRDDTRYRNAIEMFKTYSGVQNIAYDPYYNHKNQTHPSYQIIPFLWNFIERTVDNASHVFEYVKNNVFSQDFETIYAAEKIDQYIGQFGQTIDVWKHYINDYTGYTTRWERSQHVCMRTNISSEVVDYDGGFYPPALTMYMNSDSDTFIQSKYYSHLLLGSSKNEGYQYQLELLDTYRNDIARITDSYDLSNVYDIFKYDLDVDGNMFILYKKYQKPNPTYHEKLYTPGELWLRLADHPLAFPLTAQVDMSLSGINISAYDVYDFQILGTGKKMGLAYMMRADLTEEQTASLSADKSMSSYIQVMPLNMEFVEIHGTGTGRISLAENIGNDINHIVPAYTDISANEYLGMCYRSDSIVDAVFINREKSGDEIHIGVNPVLKVYSINSEMDRIDGVDYPVQLSGIVDGSVPAITEYSNLAGNPYLDAAFIVHKSTNVAKIDSPDYQNHRKVDVVQNSVGAMFDDFSQSEMNSHDVFMQDIKIVNILLKNGQNRSKIVSYNTNADLGYTPHYPGCLSDDVLDVASNEISNNIDHVYQSIEFLGRSKNVDRLEQNVNTGADPYLTEEQIKDSALFGRVYEDFKMSADNSLHIIKNKSIYPNMECADGYNVDQRGDYTWDIKFSDYGYDRSEISNLRILIYNTETLGRNPYVVSDLSTIIEDSVIGANQMFLSTDYIVETGYKDTEIDILAGNTSVKITGTCNGVDEINGFFSNALPNIKNLQMTYYRGDDILRLKFTTYKNGQARTTYIREGILRIALMNPRSFEIFEKYHFMDVNGLIKGRGPEAYFELSGQSYPLSSVTFRNFVDAAEIYVLATSERLQFKYSEEDVFHQESLNYYFPCINTKFPYTYGSYYNKYVAEQFISDRSLDYVSIFGQDSIFTVKVFDADDLLDVNGIRVCQDCLETGELRVYEDYLSTYTENGNIYRNADKYSYDDPLFYQYVRMDQLDPVYQEYGQENQLSVLDEYSRHIRIFDDHSDKFSTEMHLSSLGGRIGEETTDDSYLETTVNFGDMLKANLNNVDIHEKLEKFSRLYFAYKKVDGGIAIYVNYQNYLNSPYIRIEDGLTKNDVIDGTYAVIKPDENAVVRLVVQARIYQNNILFGIKNIVLGSYRVYNISDDKPKVVVERVGRVEFNEDANAIDMTLVGAKFERVLPLLPDGQVDMSQTMRYPVTVKYNGVISGDITCNVIFNPKYVNILSGMDNDYFTRMSRSWASLTFNDRHRTSYVPFELTPQLSGLCGKYSAVKICDEHSDYFGEISVQTNYMHWIYPTDD